MISLSINVTIVDKTGELSGKSKAPSKHELHKIPPIPKRVTELKMYLNKNTIKMPEQKCIVSF